ncbi:MAG: rRNA maturation RNase YbeY [Desulfobacterales bacterium]
MTSIQQKAKDILNALEFHDAELSILIVDDPQITKLNKQYFHRSGPTNVIAFPMHTDDFPNISPQLLGDVVISIETAAKEGKSIGIGLEKRFIQLLVHGILHLIGYDHEKSEAEAEKMEEKENEILELIASDKIEFLLKDHAQGG